MYLDFFGLKTDPFKLDPNLDFVYVSKSHEETLAHLVYGIEQGEDFVLITGGIGTGKTLALHFLLDQIVSSFKTAFVNVTTISFLELLKLILDDLEVEFEKDWDRADLLATLKKYLIQVRKQREKVLVVVDEAQNLDPNTLEGLRLLSNLSQPGEQIMQIILVGQPGLMDLINSPELEQLQQRIRVRYQLEELSRQEMEEYIEHRMNVSGGPKKVFSREAMDRIYQFSRGVPRLVNQFAGKALLAAFVEDTHKVSGAHVEEETVESSAEEVPGDDPVVAPQPEETGRPRVLKSQEKVKPPASHSPLVQEAMTSIDDVDLNEIRDHRNQPRMGRRHYDNAPQGSGSGKVWRWVAVIAVVMAGAFYLGGGTSLFSSSSEGGAGEQTSMRPESSDEAPDRGNPQANQDATAEQLPELDVQTPEQSIDTNQASLENPGGKESEDLQVAGDPPAQGMPQDDQPEVTLEQPEIAQPQDQGGETQTVQPAKAEAPAPRVLHVASFRREAQANNLINKLADQGVQGYIQRQLANGNTWYRVYLGPFADEATATKVGQDLKNQKVIMYFRLLEVDA